MKTLFEEIIEGKLPAEVIYENERCIVIKDKYPKAPLHLLIIPKKVITSLQKMEKEDYPLLGEVVTIAKQLARQFAVEKEGYRLVTNVGPYAGQTIFHLHFHFLAGEPLGGMA